MVHAATVLHGQTEIEGDPSLQARLGAGEGGAVSLGSAEGRVLVGTDGAAIGQVKNLEGSVFAVRPDGTRVSLQVGAPVFQGDVLESGEDGAVGVVLSDQTSFSMGGNGKMVLDEMIYDPSAQTGAVAISVVQGVFAFVSGQVAKTDPDAMTLKTPVATIGVRGTQVGLDIADGKSLSVVLMEEKDGFVGEVTINNAGGTLVMNNAGDFTSVWSFDRIALPISRMDNAGIVQMFAPALMAIPLTGASQNDFGLQGTIDQGAPQGDATGLAGFETAAGPAAPTGLQEPAIKTVSGDYTAGGERIAVVNVDAVAPAAAATAPSAATGVRIDPVKIEPVAGETGLGGTEPGPGPGANSPGLIVGNVRGAEDTTIALNITAVAAGENETVTVTIAGMPAGAALSAGTDNGDGTWTLTAEQLRGLTLIPPEDAADDFALTVTATAAALDGTTASTIRTMDVDVAAVADQPALSVTLGDPVITIGDGDHGHDDDGDHPGRGQGHDGHGQGYGYGHGDGGEVLRTFPLEITGALADADNSETLSFTVGGLPDGAALSAGTDNGDGTWSLTADQLDGLQLTVGGDADDAFSLTVAATATEAEGDTATTVANVPVPAWNAGDDTLAGGQGSDTLFGGSGDDRLEGGQGDDTLAGGSGDDRLEGGQGDDTLAGGAGDDRLEGGQGDDTLVGGKGDDAFVFDAKAGHDIITDIADQDKIVFDGKEFNAENMVFSENESGDVVISFNGKDAPNTSVTLAGIGMDDLAAEGGVGQGYTVSQDNNQVTVTVKIDDDRT